MKFQTEYDKRRNLKNIDSLSTEYGNILSGNPTVLTVTENPVNNIDWLNADYNTLLSGGIPTPPSNTIDVLSNEYGNILSGNPTNMVSPSNKFNDIDYLNKLYGDIVPSSTVAELTSNAAANANNEVDDTNIFDFVGGFTPQTQARSGKEGLALGLANIANTFAAADAAKSAQESLFLRQDELAKKKQSSAQAIAKIKAQQDQAEAINKKIFNSTVESRKTYAETGNENDLIKAPSSLFSLQDRKELNDAQTTNKLKLQKAQEAAEIEAARILAENKQAALDAKALPKWEKGEVEIPVEILESGDMNSVHLKNKSAFETFVNADRELNKIIAGGYNPSSITHAALLAQAADKNEKTGQPTLLAVTARSQLSDEGKKYLNNKNILLEVIGRDASGGVIGNVETGQWAEQFMPAYDDSAVVAEQKRKARAIKAKTYADGTGAGVRWTQQSWKDAYGDVLNEQKTEKQSTVETAAEKLKRLMRK